MKIKAAKTELHRQVQRYIENQIYILLRTSIIHTNIKESLILTTTLCKRKLKSNYIV